MQLERLSFIVRFSRRERQSFELQQSFPQPDGAGGPGGPDGAGGAARAGPGRALSGPRPQPTPGQSAKERPLRRSYPSTYLALVASITS